MWKWLQKNLDDQVAKQMKGRVDINDVRLKQFSSFNELQDKVIELEVRSLEHSADIEELLHDTKAAHIKINRVIEVLDDMEEDTWKAVKELEKLVDELNKMVGEYTPLKK